MSDIMDDRNYIEELRQQLAEANADRRRLEDVILERGDKIRNLQEEIRILAAQRQDYKAQAAAAVVLIERIQDMTNPRPTKAHSINEQIQLHLDASAFLQKLSG